MDRQMMDELMEEANREIEEYPYEFDNVMDMEEFESLGGSIHADKLRREVEEEDRLEWFDRHLREISGETEEEIGGGLYD